MFKGFVNAALKFLEDISGVTEANRAKEAANEAARAKELHEKHRREEAARVAERETLLLQRMGQSANHMAEWLSATGRSSKQMDIVGIGDIVAAVHYESLDVELIQVVMASKVTHAVDNLNSYYGSQKVVFSARLNDPNITAAAEDTPVGHALLGKAVGDAAYGYIVCAIARLQPA